MEGVHTVPRRRGVNSYSTRTGRVERDDEAASSSASISIAPIADFVVNRKTQKSKLKKRRIQISLLSSSSEKAQKESTMEQHSINENDALDPDKAGEPSADGNEDPASKALIATDPKNSHTPSLAGMSITIDSPSPF